MASEDGAGAYGPPRDTCLPAKITPLIQVAYPNENKSHIKANPVTGTPGVDPCCGGSPCPAYCENPSLCSPIACTAGNHDPDAPGGCYDATTMHQRQCECDKCCAERHKAIEEGKPCYQHVDGNQWQDLRRKHHDPEIQALWDKMMYSTLVKDNFQWCPQDDSLQCVDRRFRQYPFGIIGQAAVHYGAAQDKDYPRKLIHGNLSDEATPGTKLINPPPKRWVEQLDLDIKESVYESNKLRPVGKSHDQKERLPPHVDPEETAFGIPSDKSINAGILINPPKSRHQVAQESKCCRGMYKLTHGDFNPGEQLCRNYEMPFKRTNTFGTPTPNDTAGRWCKKIIGSWRSCEEDPTYVSKAYADHIDFRLDKLGMPREPNCIRHQMGPDFTYGKTGVKENERFIKEVMFNRCPNPGAEKAEAIMRNLKNWLDAVRRSFKQEFGPDCEKMYEEFVDADEGCVGSIDWDPFIRALKTHHVPISMGEKDFMEALALVGVFHPSPCDKVNYYALMDLIKGYEDPMFFCKTTTLKPYYCPHTNGSIHFRTTYSDMAANMCIPPNELTVLKEQRVHGMPSIRKDKVPNKIRSTKDFTNYGDDGDAYSLIWPSVYTLNGITCRDAFKEMTKEQLTKLMCLAKVNITHDEIDKAYEAAQALDPEGKCRVCYQTFREALCQLREEVARFQNVHISYPTEPCQTQPEIKPRRKPNPCWGVDP